MNNLLVEFDELDFVCIRNFFFNLYHFHNDLLNNCLYSFFHLTEVSWLSSELSSIWHNDNLSLVLFLEHLHKLLVLKKSAKELLFLFYIFYSVKPKILTDRLLLFSFIFKLLF